MSKYPKPSPFEFDEHFEPLDEYSESWNNASLEDFTNQVGFDLPEEAPRPTFDTSALDAVAPARFVYITGRAGTGKSTLVRQKCEEPPDPKTRRAWGLLCASTGVAAVNLGTITINSLLGYFDTASLRALYSRSHNSLKDKLHALAKRYDRLVLDELSMVDAEQLDLLYGAIQELHEYGYMEGRQFSIISVGDFFQLPPVKARWAFEAACWSEFDANTLTLEKVWRQDDLRFLEALNLIREGDGPAGARALAESGVTFASSLDLDYPGTSIVPKNTQVGRINFANYVKLPGKEFELPNWRWGQQRGEWKSIPFVMKLKPGALVMILANHSLFEYANGDLAEVLEQGHSLSKYSIPVRLKRNSQRVSVGMVERHFTIRSDNDEGLPHFHCECGKKKTVEMGEGEREDEVEQFEHAPWGQESYNCREGAIVRGGIRYWPVRLGYASTCHKSQGLTLDSVQFDCRDQFAASPNLAYVALSRCRTAGGLRVVGTPGLLAQRVRVDSKVRGRFLR